MNDPIEERLRHHLSSADRATVTPVHDLGARAARSEQRRRARHRAVAGVGSVALVVCGAAAVWIARSEPEPSAPASAPPPTGSWAPYPTDPVNEPASTTPSAGTDVPADPALTGSWAPIAAEPGGPRQSPEVVWTGTEALVVGGLDRSGAPRVDGAAYDPSTDSWRPLPEPPVVTIDPLVAWTGDEMLVIGGTSDPAQSGGYTSAGRAYDPTSDTWRATAPPFSFIDRDSPWVWTGDELLVWPSSSESTSPIAYDPSADSWRAVASAPIGTRWHAASVWTGREWLIWGGTTGDAELADGAAYDPATDTWRTLAASPLSARRVRAVWTGTEMIVDAGSTGGDRVTGNGEMALSDGAAYDPVTDTWRPITAGFAHPGFVPVWGETQMIMFAKGAAARLILSDLRAHGAGTGIELWNTPYVLHEGGGTMATLARVAVFALVGPSVLANKLVALASTTLVLVALLAAARELFGVRAAAFAGLAFVFAPEAFLRFSLLSLGTHFEAAFFVLALLALGARIGEGRDPRARVHFALGVCAGLGAYASLIVLPAIVAALGRVVFQRGRELLGRAGACLVAGALVGAAPWIWMVRNAGLDAVRIRGANPTGGAADPVRALGILAERVFAPDASRIVLVAACAAVVLTGAWACARGAAPARSHAREFVYVGAFLALFLAAYASSGFALHPDAAWFFFLRATPAWIGVVLLVAGAAAVLEESGGSPRLLARAGLGVIVLVGIVDAARLALDGRPGAPVANLRLLATTQGYDWSEYLDKLLPRLEGSVEEKLARIARVDDDP
ncbi:MAG: hypothetical protein HZB15_10560, partial [Actinobacteria bacterium]|nr:hypothetical protein [Actinomycetota bacterium]